MVRCLNRSEARLRLCDCLDVCGGAEAAAGSRGGDVESPEGDVVEQDLKVDIFALIYGLRISPFLLFLVASLLPST